MRQFDPDDPPPPTDPGDPGYIPPTTSGAVLIGVVTSSNLTFTADQITAAGGPWPSFTVRVTPINDNGTGAFAEVEYP